MDILKTGERIGYWLPIGVPVLGFYVIYMTTGSSPLRSEMLDLLIFPVVWYLVSWIISYYSGWQRLAFIYPARTPPTGQRFHAAGRLGFAHYSGCLYVYVASEGLFVSVMSPFRFGHKPLFIPWSEIHNRQKKAIYWRKGIEFDIGRPCAATMWLPKKIFENPCAPAC